MAIQIDLNKSAQSIKICLEKAGVDVAALEGKMQVALAVDVSGSFEDEHADGVTSDLMTRLTPWGLVFDANKQVDVFTFASGEASAYHVGTITAKNYEGYVRREIYGRVPGWCGGTHYAYVLTKVLVHFGWLSLEESDKKSSVAPSASLFSKVFGTRSAEAVPAKEAEGEPFNRERAIACIVTDGDNSDQSQTRKVLEKSRARGDEVFFFFFAVSNQGNDFPFLQQLNKDYPNVGLVVIPVKDLKKFVAQTDEEINQTLLTGKFNAWLKNK